MKRLSTEWVCTDPRMCQFRKKEGDGKYTFTEIDIFIIDEFGDARMDTEKYDHNHVTEEDILGDDFRTEFIELDEWNESRRASFVEAFGYCYEDVRDDEDLVAECIFEMI